MSSGWPFTAWATAIRRMLSRMNPTTHFLFSIPRIHTAIWRIPPGRYTVPVGLYFGQGQGRAWLRGHCPQGQGRPGGRRRYLTGQYHVQSPAGANRTSSTGNRTSNSSASRSTNTNRTATGSQSRPRRPGPGMKAGLCSGRQRHLPPDFPF